MSLYRLSSIILILVFSLSFCFGQEDNEFVEGEANWVKQYGIYPESFILLRYDRYSKEDTVKFREKLDLLKSAKFSDAWEGNYFRDNEQLGLSSFHLDSNAGFINFYIYTCQPELRFLNYGKIINTPEFIEVIPEFAENSPRMSKPVKYIKVKWNKWHYLVEESALAAFAEKAVGIYVEPDDDIIENNQTWSDYWVNADPYNEEFVEKQLTGLPELPASYKKFERLPIETKITTVGKRTVEAEKQIGDATFSQYFYDSAVYPVTLGAGNDKGIKKGMRFEITETGEEVFIIEVKQNTSIGLVLRNTDENKNDNCSNDDSEQKICPKLKPSLKVKTITGKFWF